MVVRIITWFWTTTTESLIWQSRCYWSKSMLLEQFEEIGEIFLLWCRKIAERKVKLQQYVRGKCLHSAVYITNKSDWYQPLLQLPLLRLQQDTVQPTKCLMLSLSIMLLWPGVDVSDQMTDHYSAELGILKCWRKVVFHLFDRTVTNAYIQLFQLRLSPDEVIMMKS